MAVDVARLPTLKAVVQEERKGCLRQDQGQDLGTTLSVPGNSPREGEIGKARSKEVDVSDSSELRAYTPASVSVDENENENDPWRVMEVDVSY